MQFMVLHCPGPHILLVLLLLLVVILQDHTPDNLLTSTSGLHSESLLLRSVRSGGGRKDEG